MLVSGRVIDVSRVCEKNVCEVLSRHKLMRIDEHSKFHLMFKYPPAKHNIYPLPGSTKTIDSKVPQGRDMLGYVSILGGYRFFFSTFFSLRAWSCSEAFCCRCSFSSQTAWGSGGRQTVLEIWVEFWRTTFFWSSEAKAETSLIPRKFLFGSIFFCSDFFSTQKNPVEVL